MYVYVYMCVYIGKRPYQNPPLDPPESRLLRAHHADPELSQI